MGLLHGLQMRLSAPSQQARHCMIHTLSLLIQLSSYMTNLYPNTISSPVYQTFYSIAVVTRGKMIYIGFA